MKKSILTLAGTILLLTGCSNGTSDSLTSVKSSIPNSAPTSQNSTSSNPPSTTPSNSLTNDTTTTLSFTAADLSETLPTTASSEETTFTKDGMELGFISCNLGTYGGANYIMMRKTSEASGAGHFYNKTALGKIASVSLTFSASTSVKVTLAATFGNSAITTAQTETNVTDEVTLSGTITIINSDENANYFNISVTNNYNCQITEVVINVKA